MEWGMRVKILGFKDNVSNQVLHSKPNTPHPSNGSSMNAKYSSASKSLDSITSNTHAETSPGSAFKNSCHEGTVSGISGKRRSSSERGGSAASRRKLSNTGRSGGGVTSRSGLDGTASCSSTFDGNTSLLKGGEDGRSPGGGTVAGPAGVVNGETDSSFATGCADGSRQSPVPPHVEHATNVSGTRKFNHCRVVGEGGRREVLEEISEPPRKMRIFFSGREVADDGELTEGISDSIRFVPRVARDICVRIEPSTFNTSFNSVPRNTRESLVESNKNSTKLVAKRKNFLGVLLSIRFHKGFFNMPQITVTVLNRRREKVGWMRANRKLFDGEREGNGFKVRRSVINKVRKRKVGRGEGAEAGHGEYFFTKNTLDPDTFP